MTATTAATARTATRAIVTALANAPVLAGSPAALTQKEIALVIGRGRSTVTEAIPALIADGAIVAVDGRPVRYRIATAAVDATDAVDATPDAGDDDLLVRWANGTASESEIADAQMAAAARAAATVDAPAAPVTVPACHCGDDTVGHVHPRAITAAPRTRGGSNAGKVDRARAAALAALTAAGDAGMTVPAVWDAMQLAGPLAHAGAYALLNTMRGEGAVTTTDERAVRSRTVRAGVTA